MFGPYLIGAGCWATFWVYLLHKHEAEFAEFAWPIKLASVFIMALIWPVLNVMLACRYVSNWRAK